MTTLPAKAMLAAEKSPPNNNQPTARQLLLVVLCTAAVTAATMLFATPGSGVLQMRWSSSCNSSSRQFRDGRAPPEAAAATAGGAVGTAGDTSDFNPAAETATGHLAYSIARSTTAAELVAAHAAAQEAALARLADVPGSQPPRAVLVVTPENIGLGNRMPSIVTGYAIALLTQRLFLLESNLTNFLDMPRVADWQQLRHHYRNSSSCSIMHKQRSLALATGLASVCRNRQAPVLYKFISFDYDVPWLQLNGEFNATLQRLFPDGAVFHGLSRVLFGQPTAPLAAALAPYLPLAGSCVVGLQMRTAKHGDNVTQFASIARSLANARPGTVFVASDKPSMAAALAAALPERRVWSVNSSIEALKAKISRSRNPGSELSAVVDMLLLSKCEVLAITPGSSYGWVSAGLGGIVPVFATQGTHDAPFHNPWFWRSVTSEPCCWGMGQRNLSPKLRELASRHPLFFYHNQCHP